MLERTAGCIENAGRRFFRDPNGSIRSRTALCTSFGQYSNAASESSHWRLAIRRTVQQDTSTTASSGSTGVSHDSRAPVLEFLYPSRTQEFVATCLLRSSKGIVSRRKKRSGPGICRTFVSEAGDISRSAQPVDIPELEDRRSNAHSARESLVKLLDEGVLDQTDTAWQLYIIAGQPSDLNSALLAQLSNSGKLDDHRRARRLFQSIPEELRSAEDYLHLAKSYLSIGQSSELGTISREAAAKGRGLPCWAFTLAHCVNNAEWGTARDLWESKPVVDETELWVVLFPNLNAPAVPQNLLDLPLLFQGSTANKKKRKNDPARDLARFLLDRVISTPEIFEEAPTETLLLLLQRFNLAGILTPSHYLRLIKTLQSSDNRSTFVRSIVLYRNFRWLMDKEIPPAKLLGGFLRQLAAFEITTGIEYFLGEFTRFYTKPTMDAYKQALVTFSRAGDVSTVEHMFEKLVTDHGKPQSIWLLTPLLNVHARAGNVERTMTEFNKISDEYGLKRNTVSWNILLTAYANADDLAGCFAQFKRMLESRVKPTAHTFGILMGLCAKRGDVDTVRQLLDQAKQRKVRMTTALLDTIVEAHCNNDDLEAAESVAESCLSLDLQGSLVRMWNLLLWHHAFRMDLEAISRIRSRMDAAGIQPDSMTYAALMLSLVLLEQTDSARRILRTLHRSRRMHATEFHYAIILYGYVRKRNRDMVHIIFREIQARFDTPGLSARLLALRSQVQRDLQLIDDGEPSADAANVRLENAERFLADTIAQFNPAKLATKQPVPGAGKQPLIEAFPAMYYESVVTAYGKRGASGKVEQLFDEFSKHQQSATSTSPENSHGIAPIRLLAALMLAYLKADQHEKVEECWKTAFRRAHKTASRPDVSAVLPVERPSTNSPRPPRSSMPNSNGEDESIPVSENEDIPPKRSPILPAYRFLLSRPLSLYMRSLAYRNETGRIMDVATEVERAGFSLTTFNWSTCVQILASSDSFPDQLRAFTIYEEKFMPNFPGWKYLRRGYGLRHSGVSSAIDMIERPNRGKSPYVLGKEGRQYWSRLYPGYMQPTYVSMVYLAAALQRIQSKSIDEGPTEVNALFKAAPKTLKAVADMPHLRDKFQGVLLRRHQERREWDDDLSGDSYYVWTGGILGVGGRRRMPRDSATLVEPRAKEVSSTADSRERRHKSAGSAPSASAMDMEDEVPPEDFQVPSQKTIDSQDQFDLEAEYALAARRRLLGTNEELLDDERFEIPYADDEEALPLIDESGLEDEGRESKYRHDSWKEE